MVKQSIRKIIDDVGTLVKCTRLPRKMRKSCLSLRNSIGRYMDNKKTDKTQTYEIRSNMEVQELFGNLNIMAEIWHKRLNWLDHKKELNQ